MHEIRELFDGIRCFLNKTRFREVKERCHEGVQDGYDFWFDDQSRSDEIGDGTYDAYVMTDPMLEESNVGRVHKSDLEVEPRLHDIYNLLCQRKGAGEARAARPVAVA